MEAKPETESPRPYRSNEGLVSIINGLLIADVLVCALRLAGHAWIRHALADSLQLTHFTQAVDATTAFLARATALFLVTPIFFLIWLHRAYSNLPALGSRERNIGPSLPATPWTAVWAWFIPVANLVFGFKVVRHLWIESQPAPILTPDGESLPRTTGLLGWWYFLYLVRGLSWGCVIGPRAHGIEAWIAQTRREIVPLLLESVSALLFMLVVRAIERRQRDQHDDQLARIPRLPDANRLR